MAKVELSLKEYDDLVTATKTALSEKLELKKQLVVLNGKYIQAIAKYLKSNGKVWTYMFREETPITRENFKEYLSSFVFELEDYTDDELFEAVGYLYYAKFN